MATATVASRSAVSEAHPSNRNAINSVFINHYRCPESFALFELMAPLFENEGYFRFGSEAICYGRRSSVFPPKDMSRRLYDAMGDVACDGPTIQLPFNPSDIVTNLRYERYTRSHNGRRTRGGMPLLLRAYYLARPLLTDSMRRRLQRIGLRDWKEIPFPQWPLDSTVERIFEKLLALLLKASRLPRIPFIWFWPEGSSSCAIMTHDVETLSGRDFCSQLMDLDSAYSIRSSFQVIPEQRYPVP